MFFSSFPLPSFSLSLFIFSISFTCLYHSPFFITYCSLLVFLLRFITFLLFWLVPFLHIFTSRAFLDISAVGVASLGPFGTYASFCVCCCDCRVPPKGCFSTWHALSLFPLLFSSLRRFPSLLSLSFSVFFIIVALARFIPSLPNLLFLPSGGLSSLSHIFKTSFWSLPLSP